MSNSSLATYKLLSPNHSGQRTMAIDRITPHCVVGQLSAAGICGCFTSSSVQASCNYGIGKDGDIGLCVEEKNRSWCTSSNANDQRAVTIECASDMTDPYAFTDKCYNSLINLCVDICKRNGKKKLIWFGDKTKTLNYSPKSDEMILTVHRWFAAKSCPGDWMYSRMGDLANKVTAKLNGNTIDTSTSTQSESPKYFVRKTFSDSSSQLGAYSVLGNAKKMVDQNPTYKVFDANGKVIYEKSNTSPTTSNNLDHKPVLKGTTDKIWMGWLKRESGTKGYRCVLGDSGAANSAYQFDYRYALVPFMQYCVDKFPSHYDGFKKYIAYGAGNSNLRGNTGLASLWLSYCDKYWDEFCSLQDSYAYTKYYLEAKKYIKNLYGIEMDNHSPAVKGTLFSMAIRSGSLTGARKFAGCNNKTSDEEMLRISYSTYGSQDASRWTKSGQYGDALNALKNNEYTSITVEGSSSPSQPSTPTTTSKTPYRVATSYSGDKYVGQIGAYDVLANATKAASEASQSAKKTYCVYDNTGAVVYTAKYKTSSTTSGKITKVSEWISTLENWEKKMIEVGAVYNNSGNKTDSTVALKQKPVTTNCALFVTHALQVAGLFAKTEKFYGAKGDSLKGSGVTTLTTKTGKIIAEYPKANTTTDKLNLIPGDIVTYYEQHTNVYVGKDANGKKIWIDAGRGTSAKGCTGSTWKSFKRTGEISGMHVAKVVRLNLIDDVSKKESVVVKPSTSTPKKLYDVKVTITDLRIRETPNGTIKGYIKPGVYGITEEKTVNGIKWGHLLSSVGWIALDYVTKL